MVQVVRAAVDVVQVVLVVIVDVVVVVFTKSNRNGSLLLG
jgi:hypothetical protein